MFTTTITTIYLFLLLFTIAFQIGLIFGKPWGEWTMGGYHKVVLPPKLRIGAFVSILILSFFGLFAIDYTQFLGINLNLTSFLKWIVISFNALSALVNTFTQSKKERNLWMPITIIMLLASLWIFLS